MTPTSANSVVIMVTGQAWKLPKLGLFKYLPWPHPKAALGSNPVDRRCDSWVGAGEVQSRCERDWHADTKVSSHRELFTFKSRRIWNWWQSQTRSGKACFSLRVHRVSTGVICDSAYFTKLYVAHIYCTHVSGWEVITIQVPECMEIIK